MKRLFILLIVALPLLANAQIYKTTDAEGNVSYSDKPPSGSAKTEELELKQTNSVGAPPNIPSPPPRASTPEAIQYTLEILSPANEGTIPNGPGNFSVAVSVAPPLGEADTLQLYINGVAEGAPQRGTSWGLTNIFRGAHDLTVGRIDEDGETVATSPAVKVYVHRPSSNF